MIYDRQLSEHNSAHLSRVQNTPTLLPEFYPFWHPLEVQDLNKVRMHVKFLRHVCCGAASDLVVCELRRQVVCPIT